MTTIDWDNADVEPGHHGTGAQLILNVDGADAAWVARFNELAAAHHQRGEVRGSRWGTVRYHEVEGLLLVDDLHGDDRSAIREHLDELITLAEARRS